MVVLCLKISAKFKVDAWAQDTAYKVGEIVKLGPSQFLKCKVDHTPFALDQELNTATWVVYTADELQAIKVTHLSAQGQQRQVEAFGCSRSTGIVSRPVVASHERPLPQCADFSTEMATDRLLSGSAGRLEKCQRRLWVGLRRPTLPTHRRKADVDGSMSGSCRSRTSQLDPNGALDRRRCRP